MSNLHHIKNRTKNLPPLRVGIGGPVGSGKTTLLEMLCKAMRLMHSQRQAFTPMLAILSAQHETQYSRLFRS